jgi:hypothetical protein
MKRVVLITWTTSPPFLLAACEQKYGATASPTAAMRGEQTVLSPDACLAHERHTSADIHCAEVL